MNDNEKGVIEIRKSLVLAMVFFAVFLCALAGVMGISLYARADAAGSGANAGTLMLPVAAAMAACMGLTLVWLKKKVNDPLKKIEESGLMSKEETERISRERTDVLFNLSHDIRTPLDAIAGFTAMARKYADDREKLAGYLDRIDTSGRQLLSVVSQALKMAGIESGNVELEEKPMNILREFEALATVLSGQADLKGLELECSLEDVEHFNILADEGALSTIIYNIAGNAMKYTPEGGSVCLTVKERPCARPGRAAYTLSVKDTGIGMSEEFQKRIFEPFSRERSSTVKKIQGTGLGMSVVKKLVDLLGGEIEVSSKRGRGTQINVTVELTTDGEARSEEPEDICLESLSGRRILLVDDSELNRELARELLEGQGFAVEEAFDGLVAVSMVREAAERGEPGYYDFIIMDVSMPLMNGCDAAAAIRSLPAMDGNRVPIIAMTANAADEDRRKALEAGMDEHLTKPMDLQETLRTLAKLI